MRAKDEDQALTGPRLAGLLARLSEEPGRSGEAYERLRRSLIRFFDWRGAADPDECADECLDRLARRLDEQVLIQDVRNFALGIARLVLLERQRQPLMTSIDQLHDTAGLSRSAREADAPVHDCFDRCLAAMPADSRTLVVSYYDGERNRKIANRRRLSASLGLSENALRSRVQRLRDRLEVCITSCLSAAARRSS